MNRDLYIQKIAQLSDERLKQLLQLRTDENQDIIILAENEALRRGIDPTTIGRDENKSRSFMTKSSGNGTVNWMGFLAEFLSELD